MTQEPSLAQNAIEGTLACDINAFIKKLCVNDTRVVVLKTVIAAVVDNLLSLAFGEFPYYRSRCAFAPVDILAGVLPAIVGRR